MSTVMPKVRSDFMQIMYERGFIHQCTDMEGLDRLASNEKVLGYVGFDATADSLHVGSLVSIMMLRWMQKTGHQPIVLMGGGTTKVGDPSGKDETRRLLSEGQINDNISGIKSIFQKFLNSEEEDTKTLFANNADWLDELGYISFLRDIGRHFTINRMLTFDSVKLRLEREQPLTFLEFNYMLLQAYDFVELHKRYGCRLQMGGADQWGNILNGMDLGRRLGTEELFGLTTPLITTSSGQKMGKTASGAVWLNAERLSPYDYWQYWRNTEDGDVGRFLRIYTEMPLEEITRLEALGGAEINEAKKILAFEATKMCHGEQAALQAAETARQTFEEGGAGENLPTFEIAGEDLAQGIPFFEILNETGLTKSKSEARRLITSGGARLNDEKIQEEGYKLMPSDVTDKGFAKLSAGRKKHVLIRIRQ